jgi:hypothetical protein
MDQQKAYCARGASLLISNGARHAERVRATRDRLNQKITSLMAEQNEISKEIATQPNNQDLMKERQEIEDQISSVRLTSTMRLR